MSDKDKKELEQFISVGPSINVANSPLTELLPHPCPVCAGMGKKLKDGMCKGHGGSGGSGGSGGESEQRETITLKPQVEADSLRPTNELEAIKVVEDAYNDTAGVLLNDCIALYESGALLVKMDSLKGDLIIEMRQDLSLAERETVTRFLEMINNAFLEFRKNCATEGIAVVNFTSKLDPAQGLAIHMPSKYFNHFVNILMTERLLPVPSQLNQLGSAFNLTKESSSLDEGKKPGYLTPFKMDLKPGGID